MMILVTSEREGEGSADAGLSGGVHRAGGVIKNQDLGPLEEGAGNAQALLLPARDIHAALSQIGVQSVGHPGEELVRAGHAAGLPEGIVVGIRVAPAQIVPDGARKEDVFLQNDAHCVPERTKVIVPHIVSAHPDGA